MKHAVTLQSNGAYWLAHVREGSGRLRRISLGAKSKVTRREAQQKCHELAAKVSAMHAPMSLATWRERYFDLRAHLSDATKARHKVVFDRLEKFFGPTTRIDKITPEDAAAFIAWLRTEKSARGETLAEFSVWGYARVAGDTFEYARKIQRIERNPFAELVVKKPETAPKWVYVSDAMMDKLDAACLSDQWRLFFALARYGGLRAAEAMSLEWQHVDLKACRMTVWPRQATFSTKQRFRIVPIQPRLLARLQECQDGTTGRVLSEISQNNYLRSAHRTLVRAGLDWEKPLHTLRKSLATDWKNLLPQSAAAKMLGHSENVADEYYYQVTPDVERLVTGAKNNQNPATGST